MNFGIGGVYAVAGGGALGWSALSGALIVAGSVMVVLVRWALHSSADLGHQASNYLTPVVALALLALLTEVSVARLDLLLVGAGLTIGVNALIRPKGHPAPEVVGSPLPTARRWIGGAPNLARFIGSCE